MATLFLSYRRSDSPDTVKLICERLKAGLRNWDVFYDHPDGRRLASRSQDGYILVWKIDCQQLWRLRQVTHAERNKDWCAASFHLKWLIQEERSKQVVEVTNQVPLPSREGRVPLPELQKRHFRATMALAGWLWF
jgi:hypothetical protein